MKRKFNNLISTSRHDRNRGSYMDADGNYVYITWEKRGRRWVEVPVCIIPRGENGENEEWIRLLVLDDYAVDLQNRYHEEHIDYDFVNRVANQKIEDGEDMDDINAWTAIVDPAADVFNQLFPEENLED